MESQQKEGVAGKMGNFKFWPEWKKVGTHSGSSMEVISVTEVVVINLRTGGKLNLMCRNVSRCVSRERKM